MTGQPNDDLTPAAPGQPAAHNVPDEVLDALAHLAHNSPVRVAARELLAGRRPASLQVFVGALRSTNANYWRERVVSAWGLARAAEDASEREGAAITLMDALQDSSQGPGEGWLWRGLGRVAGAAFLVTMYMASQSYRFTPEDAMAALSVSAMLLALVVLPASSAFDTARTDRVRASIARAAAHLCVVDCVGPLAEAYVRSSGRVADASRDALIELLPQVQPSHYGILGASSMQALCRTLRSNDSLLVVHALHALKCVGTSQALPELERLANHGRTMRIRDEAHRVLEVVRARRDDEMHRERLLRPASSPGEALLRPAPNTADTDPDFLLRAVLGDDEPGALPPSTSR